MKRIGVLIFVLVLGAAAVFCLFPHILEADGLRFRESIIVSANSILLDGETVLESPCRGIEENEATVWTDIHLGPDIHGTLVCYGEVGHTGGSVYFRSGKGEKTVTVSLAIREGDAGDHADSRTFLRREPGSEFLQIHRVTYRSSRDPEADPSVPTACEQIYETLIWDENLQKFVETVIEKPAVDFPFDPPPRVDEACLGR